jgi:DNA-binding FrmR family transcriptional regulator
MVDEKTRVLHSLRRVEGQLRGIQKMVDEERSCDDVLAQLVAAHAAIGRIGTDILMHEFGCRAGADSALSAELELERLERLLVTYANLK